MGSEDSGNHFEKLLSPLVELYHSLVLRSDAELGIDAMGRRYVNSAVRRFAEDIMMVPSPLLNDGVELNWNFPLKTI